MSDRVPICGTRETATVSRAIWDEAWLEYAKRYGGDGNQHARLLGQGFYAGELDELRPGWRPIEQRIADLERDLTRITAERDLIEAEALRRAAEVINEEIVSLGTNSAFASERGALLTVRDRISALAPAAAQSDDRRDAP